MFYREEHVHLPTISYKAVLLFSSIVFSINVNAEHAATSLEPIQVDGQREAFVNNGIEADRAEVNLTPGGVTLIAHGFNG